MAQRRACPVPPPSWCARQRACVGPPSPTRARNPPAEIDTALDQMMWNMVRTVPAWGAWGGLASQRTQTGTALRKKTTQEGMMERRLCASTRQHTQSERAISLARSRPLYSDFRRSGSSPDHNACYPRIIRHPGATARGLASLFYDTLAARTFQPPSVSSCLGRVSLPILEDYR